MANFSKETQELIDRICRNIERRDFDLDKPKAEELILKTYDLFNLPRPKKVRWYVDIFDKNFAYSAYFASSARSALDYDFDWYIVCFEYEKNPNPNKLPNENDYKYLEYCELLMQAKEAGLGYRVEWKDTLYLIPTPITRIDNSKPPRFHSVEEPAIRWKGGKELYFIHGINFEKTEWEDIVSGKLSIKEILLWTNTEKQRAAMSVVSTDRFLRELQPKEINKNERGDILYEVEGIIPNKKIRIAKYLDWSTDRVYVKFVRPDFDTIDEVLSQKHKVTIEQWLNALHA